jgi:hypothetical protein
LAWRQLDPVPFSILGTAALLTGAVFFVSTRRRRRKIRCAAGNYRLTENQKTTRPEGGVVFSVLCGLDKLL